MTVPPSSSRTRVLAAVIFLVTLIAGVALGWGMSRWSMHRAAGARHGHHFLDQLDLSTAQRARVDSILTRRRSQMDAFWAGPGMQLRTLVDSTRAEVRGVLTPEQRQRFDALRAQARAREGRGGRDEPPPLPPQDR